MGTVTSGPPVLIAMCGQDIEITTFTDLIFFKLTCSQFNGTRVLCNVTTPLQVGAFKDGVEISFDGAIIAGGSSPPPSPDLCGTYIFVIENSCGRDIEVSTVRCPGKFLWRHLCTILHVIVCPVFYIS